MGQSESTTITQGEPPPQLSQQHILRRNDISDRPFLAPQFAPFTPKTLYKIKCPFSVSLHSFSLYPLSENADRYAISFSGQCSQPFTVEVFVYAKEVVGENLSTVSIELLPPSSHRVIPKPCLMNEVGNYTFRGGDHDTGIIQKSEIEKYQVNMRDTWSAIIRMNVLSQEPTVVHSLLVYCTMRLVEGVPKMMVVAQKCLIQNNGFYITEMYGLGDLSRSESESKECVICMTNDRDTCVLPCRHICCCAECANTLRLQTDRCPVCRELMTELVYLTVNPDYMGVRKDEDGNQVVEMQSL